MFVDALNSNSETIMLKTYPTTTSRFDRDDNNLLCTNLNFFSLPQLVTSSQLSSSSSTPTHTPSQILRRFRPHVASPSYATSLFVSDCPSRITEDEINAYFRNAPGVVRIIYGDTQLMQAENRV
jgi:hypothetical protein